MAQKYFIEIVIRFLLNFMKATILCKNLIKFCFANLNCLALLAKSSL